MVRVINKRIIAFLLCVALTFGAVSEARPTEAKAFVLDFLSAEALQALIVALQAAAGQVVDAATDVATSSDALADTSNILIAAENFVYYIMAKRIIPLVDDAGQRFAGYVTSNFVFENSVSYDNVDDYFRAMDPSKSQEVINDPEFICAVPYDPSQLYYLSPAVVESTQSKLKERGTSLMEIMQRLRDCGVTTYQSFVSALKDILKDTANVLVNDQTKAMFNAILQVTSNAAREVARANGGGDSPYRSVVYDGHVFDIGDAPYYWLIEENSSNKNSEGVYYELFIWNEPDLYLEEAGNGNYYLKSQSGKEYLYGDFYSDYWYRCTNDSFYVAKRNYDEDFKLIETKKYDWLYPLWRSSYFGSTTSLGGNCFDNQPLEVVSSSTTTVYTGLPDVSVLENAGSLDALVEEAKTKDDTVAWINPNAQVADADADAAEAEALAEQVTLINQGIDKSNNWFESIFNSIKSMATTVTNIFDVLSTGLSKMLTGAADRVVEGFQDIFIDDVGDNVLERACTSIDNLVEGVGDLAGLKEAVEAIEAATGEQVKLLTAEDAVAAELKTQLGGADLNGLFKLVYLLIYILIKLLMLFLRCLSLIVVVFKVPATTGFLPEGMIQGLNWIKAFEIPNFNINLWDFMFLLIYIVLTFRVIGAIKHHIDKISV